MVNARQGQQLFLYRRGALLLALNPSAEAVEASVDGGTRQILFSIGGGAAEDGTIRLEPQSFLVLR